MKVEVRWASRTQVPVPCPNYRPDPYTGESPTVSCCVYHSATVTKTYYRGFDTEAEADAFIAAGPKTITFHKQTIADETV